MAIHVPIAGVALIPVVLAWPLVLLPVHIVFLELIIDPACSIAFEAEPEEKDVMDRPPRRPTERLFERRAVTVALLQGLLAFALVAAVLGAAVVSGYDDARSRSLAFSTLVLTNLGLILANRSSSRGALAMLRVPNPALWWVVGGALAVLLGTLALAPVRSVFRFGTPSALDLAAAVATAGVALVGFELLKGLGNVRPRVLTAALALGGGAFLLLAAGGAEAAPPAGEALFRRYCASCHGEGGRGDGFASPALEPRPTDLTRIHTSVSELMRQIDGRRTIRAHGPAAMPVWGEVFEQSLIREPHRRRTALLTVEAIAEYVRALRLAPSGTH